MLSENKLNVKHKNRNYGICILKMFMAYIVVCCHFLNANYFHNFFVAYLSKIAVPVFMFLACYFFAGQLRSINCQKLKVRLFRLYWPLISWAFIYMVVYSIAAKAFHLNNHISISSFFFQLLFGHGQSLNPAMWFQFVLLVISLLIFLGYKFYDFSIKSPSIFSLIMIVFLIICYYLQYSEYNYILFKDFPYGISFPFGRIIEMVPFAVASLLIFYYNIFTMFSSKQLMCISLVGIFFSALLFKFDQMLNYQNFGYAGLSLLLASVCISAFFYSLPINNLVFQKKLDTITSYTLGIYCMHNMLGQIITHILDKVSISINGFVLCICIYFLSYISSLIISKTGIPLLKKMVV